MPLGTSKFIVSMKEVGQEGIEPRTEMCWWAGVKRDRDHLESYIMSCPVRRALKEEPGRGLKANFQLCKCPGLVLFTLNSCHKLGGTFEICKPTEASQRTHWRLDWSSTLLLSWQHRGKCVSLNSHVLISIIHQCASVVSAHIGAGPVFLFLFLWEKELMKSCRLY